VSRTDDPTMVTGSGTVGTKTKTRGEVMSAKLLAATAVQNLQQARGQHQQPAAAGPAAVIDNAVTALLAYIPTEATAIYLATVSALPAIQQALPLLKSSYIYWAFVL